eukprot:TRINITY_DN6543_c0_g2_i1.p1 TRINITY_DN6543_c0_g2~~TRINITY_DN6543_c0_g2_i1.p1  ORF type:complete len:338 (-),score=78.51 TRINITY_DN6543_c0_g2_i1:8-964(-)
MVEMGAPTSRIQRMIWATIANYLFYCMWTMMNKSLFAKFPFPLFSTMMQMATVSIIAFIVVAIRGQPKPVSFSTVMPLVGARSVDIGCGNLALIFISVPLQQIIKSLIPIFVCILQVVFRRRYVSQPVWISMIPLVGGSMLTTFAEGLKLTSIGIIVELFSVLGRAGKAVLSDGLLNDSGKIDTYTLLKYESPGSAAAVGIMASLLEGSLLMKYVMEHSGYEFLYHCAYSALLGLLMFLVQVSYLELIASSSAITCQVLMNVKMLLLVVIATILTPTGVFTVTKGVGIAVTFLGGLMYSWAKQREMVAKQREAAETIQ